VVVSTGVLDQRTGRFWVQSVRTYTSPPGPYCLICRTPHLNPARTSFNSLWPPRKINQAKCTMPGLSYRLRQIDILILQWVQRGFWDEQARAASSRKKKPVPSSAAF